MGTTKVESGAAINDILELLLTSATTYPAIERQRAIQHAEKIAPKYDPVTYFDIEVYCKHLQGLLTGRLSELVKIAPNETPRIDVAGAEYGRFVRGVGIFDVYRVNIDLEYPSTVVQLQSEFLTESQLLAASYKSYMAAKELPPPEPVPFATTGSMIAGGAAFGAAFGVADVALDAAGTSENVKHGILGSIGVYFLTQAAATAPVDLLAMFPSAIPGAIAGAAAGEAFSQTFLARKLESLSGYRLNYTHWSTLGAATGGGLSAGIGVALARQTALYGLAAKSAAASMVSGAATAVLGVVKAAAPIALAGAAGYAAGTGLDYGLGYLFTRSGSLSTAIATTGDGAIDVPEGSSEHYLEKGWSYVPDTM